MHTILFVVVTISAVLVGLLCRLYVGYAVMIALCVMPFARTQVSLGFVPIGVRAEDILLVVLAARYALAQRRVRLAGPVRRFFLYYTILGVFVVVSFAWTLLNNPLNDISFYLLQKAIGASVMLFLGCRIITTASQVKTVILAAVLAGVVLCATVLMSDSSSRPHQSSARFDAALYDRKLKQMEYLQSWNPNVIGLSLGMLVFAAFAIYRQSSKTRGRLLGLGIVGLFLFVLIRGYTRTAIIALGVSLVYTAVRAACKGRAGALIVIVAGLVIAPATAGLWLRPEAFRMDLTTDTNTGYRLTFWRAGIDAVLASPFGYGAGVGEKGMSEVLGIRESAHNDWLDFALNIGIAGSLWAGLVFMQLGRCLIAHTRLTRVPWVALIAEGFFVFLLVASMGLQVLTFTKQAFAMISVLLAVTNIGLNDQRRLVQAVSGSYRPSRD